MIKVGDIAYAHKRDCFKIGCVTGTKHAHDGQRVFIGGRFFAENIGHTIVKVTNNKLIKILLGATDV